ncbi:MAG TPA: PspA/IM30 family protein [Xanthomonadales bacterium]|nr:PspA/IM30 family protein [Xanthomonadales bacterium]
MGAISRLRYVIAANVNALLEKAEDPEKLLRALIREMEDASEEARMACADLLAEQQHLERLERQLGEEKAEWQHRAERAVSEGRDDLARAALKAVHDIGQRHDAVVRDQGEVRDRVEQMENDMVTLKGKLAEAKGKRKALKAGKTPAAVSHREQKISPTEKKVRRAMSRFDRLETQVENLEARVRSYEVGGSAPSVWGPSHHDPDPLVEEELAAMKNRLGKDAQPRSENTADQNSQENA